MVMESIDLGDRRELIDLIYGPQKGEIDKTPTASSTTLTPRTENEKIKKTKKSRVVCSYTTILLLFILAAAAVILSGFISYWLTRQEYEMKLAALPFAATPRRNMTKLMREEETYEEEEPSEGPTMEELRLPDTLEPIWYNMTLKMYLPGYVALPEGKNFTTDGNILIKLAVKQPTTEIVLNAKDLSFPMDANKVKILTERFATRGERQVMDDSSEMKMENSTNNKIKNSTEKATANPVKRLELVETGTKVVKIVYNNTLEKVSFILDGSLEAGNPVILQLPFNGRISDNLTGLFVSSYMRSDGRSRLAAVTDIQPGSARTLFPCFDEPHFKAPLSLTILHPKGTTATANAMEIAAGQATSDPMWLKTSFDATRPLPTSLTAFTLTDFVKAQTTTDTGAKIRVYSRPEAINSTEFALETSTKVLEFLQRYLAVPPRSAKLDVFALPELAKAEMSGDGLILVREDRLLYDPKLDTIEGKVQVAQTICHEFTKQWFGNVMGKSDIRGLWMNDALAKYMEYICLENLFTGLDKNSYQTVDSVEQALLDDARSLSHPMVLDMESPSGAGLMADEITSDKGAALLRMLKEVIGEDNFQRGIQDFLKNHHADGNDKSSLWDAWNHVVPLSLKSWDGEKLNVTDFMDKWIKQMGYPVVEVDRIDDHTVELTQRRFKLDHLTPEKAKYRNALYWYKWDVPIFHEVNGKPQSFVWLHEAIRLPLNTSDNLLINTGSLGFYRVNYDEEGWARIARQLNEDHTKYSPSARARIISDALALAEAGLLPYETALGIISYLPKEMDLLPWSAAVKALDNLYDRVSDTDLEESTKDFILEKLTTVFNTIDFDTFSFADGDDILESRTKREIVQLYCKLSPDDCTRKLTQQFETNVLAKCSNKSIASVCSSVPPTGRSMVYCAGVAQGGDMEFKRIHQLSRREVNAAEKIRLTNALACSRDPRKLRKLMYECVKPGKASLHKSDMYPLIAAMNDQPVGAEIVSDFILDNWKEVTDRFSQDRSGLSAVLENAVSLNSEREIKQFERFLVDHKSSARDLDVLKRQLEIARNRQHWLKMNRKALEDYMGSKRVKREL